jgi:uncharacterized protein YggE
MTAFRLFVPVALLAMLGLQAIPAGAQTTPGQFPGFVVSGIGTASEAPQAATLQFLIGSADPFTMRAGTMETIEAVPAAAASPGSESSGPSSTNPVEPGWAPFEAARLSLEQLEPIVAALEGAGVDGDDIQAAAPVDIGVYGPVAPGAGEILVAVDDPEAERLQELIAVVDDTVQQLGLTAQHVGVRYEPEDCDALIQSARDAAVADARERAAALSESLGMPLGELVQASETPFFGSPEMGACAPEGTEWLSYGPYGPGTYPAFDARSVEAKVTIQITLTYSFGAMG